METLKGILDAFFEFKAYVMFPIIIALIALVVRLKPGEVLLSSLKLATGFAGVFIVFSFFVDNLRPAVETIARNRGLDFPVLDVGWPPLAAITWASPLAPLSIPLVILLNIIMIATRTGRTIYIDIWNYWHFAFAGVLVNAVTGNFWLGLAAMMITALFCIKAADWTTPYVEQEAGLPGVTLSPLSVVGLTPFALFMDAVYDKVPGLRKVSYNPERSGSKAGLLTEPMVIGSLLGILLGLLAGYSVKLILELAVHIAAVMFLLPKCGTLIVEGIEPVTRNLREMVRRRFPDRQDLAVAMDTGIVMKNRSVVITGLILMPVTLIISLFIPGNRTLPLGDLPNLISIMSVVVFISRGNVIRAVLTGIPVTATFLVISSSLAGLITRLSHETALSFGSGVEITAFTDGGHQFRFFLLRLFQGNIPAFAAVPFVIGLLVFASRRSAAKRKPTNRTADTPGAANSAG